MTHNKGTLFPTFPKRFIQHPIQPIVVYTVISLVPFVAVSQEESEFPHEIMSFGQATYDLETTHYDLLLGLQKITFATRHAGFGVTALTTYKDGEAIRTILGPTATFLLKEHDALWSPYIRLLGGGGYQYAIDETKANALLIGGLFSLGIRFSPSYRITLSMDITIIDFTTTERSTGRILPTLGISYRYE